MNKLDQLVSEYQRTHSDLVWKEISIRLKDFILKKCRYVYYRQYFPISLFHKQCKACLECNIKDKKKCRDCEKCTCPKGTFNLAKWHLCEYNDVEQDFYLDLFKMIENFDTSKNFATYFNAYFYAWRPQSLNKEMVANLKKESLYYINHEGEEVERNLPIYTEYKTVTLEEILVFCENSLEKDVLLNLFNNSELSQEDLAKKLGISQQEVSDIIIKLREQIKKSVK